MPAYFLRRSGWSGSHSRPIRSSSCQRVCTHTIDEFEWHRVKATVLNHFHNLSRNAALRASSSLRIGSSTMKKSAGLPVPEPATPTHALLPPSHVRQYSVPCAPPAVHTSQRRIEKERYPRARSRWSP